MILKYDIMFEFNIGYLIMHMITSNMNIKAVNDIDIDICCHCWIESWLFKACDSNFEVYFSSILKSCFK